MTDLEERSSFASLLIIDDTIMSGERNDRREPHEVRIGGKIVGTIKRWIPEKGFGFLRLADGSELFCHTNDLCEHLQPPRGEAPALDTRVIVGKVINREKGQAAKEVQCDECATPEQWELRPTGSVIFGVQEFKPACVNKPNVSEYKSTIPYGEVYEANEPFREAQKKQRLWQGQSLTPDFFTEFGEPDSIQAEGDDKIVLAYSIGTKRVSSSEAFQSEHWETSPSNEWREKESCMEAEFSFSDIPGAKTWRIVAYRGTEKYYSHPRVMDDFERLSPAVQEEILLRLKESVQSPENIAGKRWDDFMKRVFEKEELEKIRQDVIDLQAPGESYIDSRSIKSQRETTASYGDETWGTGYYHDITVTESFLVVGAKKREVSGWAGKYSGGKEFPISSNSGDVMVIKQQLLAGKQKRFKEIFEKAKKYEPIPEDRRIYDLSPEEWAVQYSKVWDMCQRQCEQVWQAEDQQALAQLENDKQTYETEATQLQQSREAVDEVRKRARELQIDLESLRRPQWGEIGTHSLESLRESVITLQEYVAEANNVIAEQLRQRGEIEIARAKSKEEAERALREAMEAPATPAPWYLSGVDPARLEAFGRKKGEGFGAKVAGKPLFLPGDRAVVGVSFSGGTSRYSKEISTTGLVALEYGLPSSVGKRGTELLALVDDHHWNVRWTENRDGVPYQYALATAKGIGKLWPSDDREDGFESTGWDGIAGEGPTVDEIKVAHGLVSKREPTVTIGELFNARAKEKQEKSKKEPKLEKPKAPKPEVKEEEMTEGVRKELLLEIEILRSALEESLKGLKRPTVKGKPNEKEKATEALLDNAGDYKRQLGDLEREIQLPNTRVVSIRGKIASVRGSITSGFNKNLSFLVEGYRSDWMAPYREAVKSVEVAVDASNEAGEYIKEGLITRDELVNRLRDRVKGVIPRLQKGQAAPSMDTLLEQILADT